MPWHKAAEQMREFIAAMNAIFDCWYKGERLAFEGEYYQHRPMPSTFAPEDVTAPRPRIVLSATGPLMTQVAAALRFMVALSRTNLFSTSMAGAICRTS